MWRITLISLVSMLSIGLPLPASAAENKDDLAPRIVSEGEMLRLRLPERPSSGHILRPDLPQTSREWLDRMLDATRHGIAFKDPQAFVEWLDAMTEPQFMTALAAAAQDSNTYHKSLQTFMQPETARNWAEFSNPVLYMRWMLTGSNPDFYKAIIERMADPEKIARWVRYGSGGGPLAPTLFSIPGKTSDPAHTAWQRLPGTESSVGRMPLSRY